MVTYKGNIVLEVLQNWGYNKGEFEEIVVRLARKPYYVKSATAKYNALDNYISYELDLSEKGKRLYVKWCKKYGYHSSLKGNLKSILLFEDDNDVSVGITKVLLREKTIKSILDYGYFKINANWLKQNYNYWYIHCYFEAKDTIEIIPFNERLVYKLDNKTVKEYRWKDIGSNIISILYSAMQKYKTLI